MIAARLSSGEVFKTMLFATFIALMKGGVISVLLPENVANIAGKLI